MSGNLFSRKNQFFSSPSFDKIAARLFALPDRLSALFFFLMFSLFLWAKIQLPIGFLSHNHLFVDWILLFFVHILWRKTKLWILLFWLLRLEKRNVGNWRWLSNIIGVSVAFFWENIIFWLLWGIELFEEGQRAGVEQTSIFKTSRHFWIKRWRWAEKKINVFQIL